MSSIIKSKPLTRVLAALVILALVLGSIALPASHNQAYAAEATTVTTTATKTKVTLTIKMGNQGNDCPLLVFKKAGSKKLIEQAVTKWVIDGKTVKNPWSKFYSKNWDFTKHTVTIKMSIKVPKGTYKVTLNNGTKTKTLIQALKVNSTAIAKTVKF
jgi:hypothetical protein